MSDSATPFFNFYAHNFVRVAVGTPRVRVADPLHNAAATVELMEAAAKQRSVIVLFPELGLSAYSCEDLFHQRALLDAVQESLTVVLRASERLPLVAVVGLPLQVDQLLYNCAAVVHRGRLLGIVPKTYLPNYREFYEARQFTPGSVARQTSMDLCDQPAVPFGSRLLFRAENQPELTFHVEICEDVWVPIPPSSHAALAGATVLLNLSASNITVAKADYRRELVTGQSARCIAAYLYSGAGAGESTTDLAWDGDALIGEMGNLLAESERFNYQPHLITAEIDLERISMERMRQNTFGQNVQLERDRLAEFRTVGLTLDVPRDERLLLSPGRFERYPYVPSDPKRRDERCAEVFDIQVQGLAKRLQFTGIEKVVIGISGGLDSTHALLVCAQAMDVLGYARSNILAYTMPGFATGERTRAQALKLMQAVGCSAHEIDIRPSARQMLSDIDHPFAAGEPVYDVTFENVQAGERTSHLFRLANFNNALVVGTGDLSELALGWSTYGVGDQMSHYNVNASVPKTLIQHVMRWVAETRRVGAEASQVLFDVLATEISPELVPGANGQSGVLQSSEATIGPYELQDFHLYYILRFGYAPPRVAFLAYNAWHHRDVGEWPGIPLALRREYGIGDIKRHLRTFVARFFGMSQYKRSAVPNSPKVGSGGSLSPRGDWRAPSDGEATVWLAQMEHVPDVEASPGHWPAEQALYSRQNL
ncbi:MAG TPA: NAD(+) synthase [Chloroflexota bacterium]|nr:NAD(+) synthase [Chloroflexota bacterium]